MELVHYRGKPSAKREAEKREKKIREKMSEAADLFRRYSLDQIKSWKSLDLYYLLGTTEEEAENLTESQFKEIFRKRARMFHPDCLKLINIQDNGLSFIALTKAHYTLSSASRRRLYNHAAFDEELPEDREYMPEEFFEVFSDVFRRNEVFSAKEGGFSLGDQTTPESEVVAFYKFWQGFESSRVFDFFCEDEDCTSRESRRHIAQQNKEMLDRKKAEDNRRIRKLVSLSIKHDPRIKKVKQSAEVTVDADGWKSTEVERMVQLLKMYPASLKNRQEIVFSNFSKYFPNKEKKDVLKKIIKIEMENKKGAKK